VRSPAKTTLTSFAASDLGAGKAFAINELMDQIGGLLGPLLVFAILEWQGKTAAGFAFAFVSLGAPALASVLVLLRARRLYPDPKALEHDEAADQPTRLGPRYRLYLVGVALIAIGLADWPLLAYHFAREDVVGIEWLPVVYAAAMGLDGLISLGAGLLFDRRRRAGTTGAGVLAGFVIAGAAYAPLAFAASASARYWAIGGVALWSVTNAATNSIAKAMIAAIVPRAQRGRAYGLYFLVFGVAWWAGSLLLGTLYDHARPFVGPVASVSLVAGAAVVFWSGAGIRTPRPGT
jgi:MFS family permease